VGDEFFLQYNLAPNEKLRTIRLEREGAVLRGRLAIEPGTGFVSAYFIGRHAWDLNAKVAVMVFGPDGKAASGAWQQKMIDDFSAETYMSSFDKERALHPENYAIYRDKWMIESMFKKAELKAIIDKDLGELERRLPSKESAGLLYALANGHWMAGRDEAGRRHLRRLVEIAPADSLTVTAISNYDYQAFSQQWKGDGPEEVRKLRLGLFERKPGSAGARRLFERAVYDERLRLETARAVCAAWIADEPDNPEPRYYLAWAEKAKGGAPADAETSAATALELYLKGHARFYGDIGGSLTQMRLPAVYTMLAELRRDRGALAAALADLRAARSMTKETRPDQAKVEASIWSALGAFDKAEACWLEAGALGHKEAEKEVRAIYERRRGTAEGFEAYLAQKTRPPAPSGGAAAGGSAIAAAGGGGTGAAGAKPPAPNLAFKTLDGREAKLADLKGKVVVLNFWFIGCAPCRVEIPGLNKLVEEYKGKDVVFLAFANNEEKLLREFLEASPFKYEIVPQGEPAAKLFDVSVYPTHIIIDKAGAVAYFLTGGSPERHEQLAPLIDNLLR
jgi:thiol-disulfide isomerase/thioredoxin